MADARNGTRPLARALWVLAVLGVALPVGIAAWSQVAHEASQCSQASRWKARGDAAFAAGDYGIAARAYSRGRTASPARKDLAPALARARLFDLAWSPDGLRQADLDDVRVDLDLCEGAYPADAATFTALRGFLASATGRIAEGEKLYRKALESDKANGPAHLGLALLLRRQGSERATDVVAELKEVVKARPGSPDMLALLGRAQLDLGDVASAFDTLKAAVDLRQDGAALRDLGVAALGKQDVNTAIQYLQDATRMDPRDPVTLSNLAQAFMLAKKPDMAERAARSAMAVQPEDPTTAFRLAAALNAQRKYGEAVPLLQRLAANSNDLMVFHELGIALAGVGRLQEAAAVLTRVVQAQAPNDEDQAKMFKAIQADAAGRLEQILGAARAAPGKAGK